MSSHPEASLELVLSSPMCNVCEFFGLDSDEEVCRSLVYVVSGRLLVSCVSARLRTCVRGRILSSVTLMFRFITGLPFSQFFLHKHKSGQHG